MSTAIPVHVGIVDHSGAVSGAELEALIGALNEQVTADFAPAWGVHATVGSYEPSSTHEPLWKILLQDTIDQPGAAGYHADQHRQPYAIVDVSAGDWTVTTSHELLEMLADPFGSRMHTASPPVPAPNANEPFAPRVHYLLEVCDPCEMVTYEAGGVQVSDFLLPGFYRSSPRRGVGYSHTGALTGPRLVLPGGYVSFYDPRTGHWWQRFVDEQGTPTDNDLGPATGRPADLSLREWIDQAAREFRTQHGR